jgi:hypothetical protein
MKQQTCAEGNGSQGDDATHGQHPPQPVRGFQTVEE